MKDQQTKYKINTAAEANALENGSYNFGQSMPFTCPECCGVLNRLQNDNIVRYKCSMGHDYSADSLIMALTEKIEYALYNALRGMDESIMLLNHLGDYFAEANEPKFAAVYFKKAKETDKRSKLIRRAALEHEQLLKKSLKKNLT